MAITVMSAAVQSDFVDPTVPEEVRRRVLAAAFDELTRWGLERFSVPTMCARYGLDEAVVTRFWGTSRRVALDPLLSWSEDILNPPDTGSLRTDLHGLAAGVARQANTEIGRSLMRAMVVDGRAAFNDDTRMEFWKQRFAAVRSVMDRAAERGELRAGVDILGAMQLVLAPLNVRALYTREPIDDAYCQTIAELAWHAIKA